MVKCAIVTSRLDKPSFYYRFVQHESILNQNNIQSDYFIVKGRLRDFLKIIKLNKYKVIIFHRTILSPFLMQLIRDRYNKHIIFDFDDALMFSDSLSVNKEKKKSFFRMISFCRSVIAGNHYLFNFIQNHCENPLIIPTPVDLTRFLKKEPDNKSKIVIGWIGSASTTKYINELKEPLQLLIQKYPQLELKVISDNFDNISNDIKFLKKYWSRDDEVYDIHSFDIGIMPLPDDKWTRGKCGFKLLQYLACGIPSVASPVGVNCEIIKDGTNGFLASDSEQWFEKISRLIESFELRKNFSLKGFNTVKLKYSTDITGPVLSELIKE